MPALPDGVLVVDKPQGPTSHDVVAVARRALGVSRIGHTGTLDPMATGVLPLVVGKATRLAQYLTAGDKDYDATITFGRTTDSYDATGATVTTSDERPNRAQLDQAIEHFRGTFEQMPPAYSAKSVGGVRAYTLARQAQGAVVLRPVSVAVHRLEVVSFDGESATLSMRVAAGFYVRSLAHDLGTALGTGAVLEALRRTRSGGFDLAMAVPLDEVVQTGHEALSARIAPFDGLLPNLPSVVLKGPAGVERVKNGQEMTPSDILEVPSPLPALVRVMGPDGRLVGLAKPGKTPGCLHAAVVFA